MPTKPHHDPNLYKRRQWFQVQARCAAESVQPNSVRIEKRLGETIRLDERVEIECCYTRTGFVHGLDARLLALRMHRTVPASLTALARPEHERSPEPLDCAFGTGTTPARRVNGDNTARNCSYQSHIIVTVILNVYVDQPKAIYRGLRETSYRGSHFCTSRDLLISLSEWQT